MRSSSLLERARDAANEWELPLVGGVGDAISSLLNFDPRDTMADVVNPMQIPAAAMTSIGKRALTPALNRVRDKIGQRFGSQDVQGRGLADMFDAAMRKKNVRPTVVDDFAENMDDYDLAALLDIAGDTPTGKTSNIEGLVNHPNFMDRAQQGLSSANPSSSSNSLAMPKTSTRVEEARRAVEGAGIDTQMARQIVPRRGTDAERFRHGLQSIVPQPVTPSLPGSYPTIESLIGGNFTDLGRAGVGGISPKHILRSASGDHYMHKGTTWQGNVGDNFAGIALADPLQVAGEDATSKLAQLLSLGNKTPWAQTVAENGTLQPMLHNSLNLETVNKSGIQPFLQNPNLVHQLQDEQVVDTLLKVSDRHRNQFLLSPNRDTVYSIDKGVGYLDDYLQPRIVQPTVDGPYGSFSGALRQSVDPNVYQAAAQRMKQVPENQLRSAMEPMFRARGIVGGDQDTLLRNFLQAREHLPASFDAYYQRAIRP